MREKRPFSPKEFKEIFSKVPRLCVDIVIQTPEGVVLLLRKLPSWHGLWHLPGGTVYYKEKISDAIQRVALDELGVSVKVERLLGYAEFPSEENARGFGWSVALEFLCSADISKMRRNEDAHEIGIFKKLPKNIIKEHREFLKNQTSLNLK